MSDNKEKENEFERDFSEEVEKETTLNDDTSDLTDEKILKTNKETLKIMSQTLASIDTKIDIENLQLQRLEELSEIKDQLNRLENVSVATNEVAPEYEFNAETETETESEVEGEIPQSSIGHNQQEIVELLEKIQTLENKILIIESQSNNSNERFKKIESVVKRYEDLESEIPNLFKNVLKKKEETKNYKKEIELETVKTVIPNDITNIIEDAEDGLDNTSNEILISEDYKEEFFNDDKKPKSNNLNYGLGILLFLCAVIVILFFFNELQIINLNFDNVMSRIFSLFNNAMSNIYSLIDLFLK